ncbi:MAG: hypothetical protein JWR26_2747 [Pedosphaera sp.]|nr:hypothetical protein [Pedosphaera sp.]
MNIINSSWMEGAGLVGSARRMGRMGSMGPSTARRSSSALRRVPRAGRTGCSRRVPRAGRALCRGTRSSAKRVPVCGPAAQNQELRGTACWPVTTATMGGGARLPRFVPLWPALPHRVFFFGEGKGCPTLRGVSTGGACARPSWGWVWKGRMGGRGWQTTRHDPPRLGGILLFCVFRGFCTRPLWGPARPHIRTDTDGHGRARRRTRTGEMLAGSPRCARKWARQSLSLPIVGLLAHELVLWSVGRSGLSLREKQSLPTQCWMAGGVSDFGVVWNRALVMARGCQAGSHGVRSWSRGSGRRVGFSWMVVQM